MGAKLEAVAALTPGPAEYLNLVLRSSREQFAEAFPHYFLVGTPTFNDPEWSQRTDVVDFTSTNQEKTTAKQERVEGVGIPMVLPLRKVQAEYPSMITVGRAVNCDVVIRDPQMSKFHAFFRLRSDHILLCDAGSTNGTFLASERLPPKGPARMVVPGDVIGFGQLDFTLLDPGECWERLHTRSH